MKVFKHKDKRAEFFIVAGEFYIGVAKAETEDGYFNKRYELTPYNGKLNFTTITTPGKKLTPELVAVDILKEFVEPALR